MAGSDLWFREFTRHEGDDIDRLADAAFLKANFTDFFGKWLQKGSNSNVLSFDALVSEFWDGSQASPQRNTLSVFSVADGGDFRISQQNASWLSQSLRFVAFAASGVEEPFDDVTPDSWTLCIVGSSALDSNQAFLQVASWDTKMFRFYQRSTIEGSTPTQSGWIYQGASVDAFSEKMSYLGPFNGHINGAIVMKELHKPWLHWHTDNHSLVGNIPQSLRDRFQTAPYLTDPGTGSAFSNVKSAESMEPIVEAGVSKWYGTRRTLDFFDGEGQLRSRPSNTRRWMSHVLLTTTINIIVAQTISQKWFAPANHFYDREMFSQYSATNLLVGLILPPTSSKVLTGVQKGVKIPNFEFSKSDYKQASQAVELALIQDVRMVPAGHEQLQLPEGTLGGGKQTSSFDQTRFVEVHAGELRDVMFTVLQPSFEDAQGVLVMQNIKGNAGQSPTSLLSAKTFNALMMLDFWNPVYSWRRATLMQYVPTSTVFNDITRQYDLEDEFIANVKKSKFYLDDDPQVRKASPEYQFISLLDAELKDHQARIQTYFDKVQTRLKTIAGLTDYIRLAESRRRIYRPLPIDEFALTLPYALKYGPDPHARFEMTEAGEIQTLPQRGADFFRAWTGTQDDWSLAGYDPHLIPRPDGSGGSASSLAEPAAVASMRERLVQASAGRCPYRQVLPEHLGVV